jgi:hypothetical protein
MNRRFSIASVLGVGLLLTVPVQASENPRLQISMDQGWLFSLENPTNAESPVLNNSAWRKLDVPHDWSIDGPFDEKNPSGGEGGFLPTGIGCSTRNRSARNPVQGASPRTWKVPFERGTIKAIGKNRNHIVANHELQTAGKPSKILKADRTNLIADWEYLAYIEATVVDRNGILVPDAAELISFKVAGPGSIAAVDNGDNSSHQPFHANNRQAYQGRCFAIVKAHGLGNITVETSGDGLASASTKIQAVASRN